MDQVAKIVESLTKPRFEEDSVDRLNYHTTSLILLAAAFTIIAKEYGGDPIQCWLPAEMASQKAWEQYAEDYCFIENTYYVPLHQNIPQSMKHRKEKMLTYYQWVPFMLMLQAMMFALPHIFWRMLNWTTGIQTRAVISMACSAKRMKADSDQMISTITAIANQLNSACQMGRSKQILVAHSNPLVMITRLFGKFHLSCIYITTKLLFISNAYLQFCIVSKFLGVNGFELTHKLFTHPNWQANGYFPRVTMCDLKDPAMKLDSEFEEFIGTITEDCVLVMRLLAQNSGDLVASVIITCMFEMNKDKFVF